MPDTFRPMQNIYYNTDTMRLEERPAELPAVERVAAAASRYVPEHWPDYVPPRLPPAASQAPPMSDVLERTSAAIELVQRIHRRQANMVKRLEHAVQRSLEDTQERGVLVLWHTDGLGWDVQLSSWVPAKTILEVRQDALESWKREGYRFPEI